MKLEWRLLATGQVVGLALVLAGWIQASGALRPTGQIGPLNLGIAGATVAVAAGVRFLAHGRRAVTDRRRAVVHALRFSAGLRPVRGNDLRPELASGAGLALVASPAMTRFHRAGCLLVAGKPVTPASRRSHEAASRRPCGVCTP